MLRFRSSAWYNLQLTWCKSLWPYLVIFSIVEPYDLHHMHISSSYHWISLFADYAITLKPIIIECSCLYFPWSAFCFSQSQFSGFCKYSLIYCEFPCSSMIFDKRSTFCWICGLHPQLISICYRFLWFDIFVFSLRLNNGLYNIGMVFFPSPCQGSLVPLLENFSFKATM